MTGELNDPELGRLAVCYWRPPTNKDDKYPRWAGGWYPMPPERRSEFEIVRAAALDAFQEEYLDGIADEMSDRQIDMGRTFREIRR